AVGVSEEVLVSVKALQKRAILLLPRGAPIVLEFDELALGCRLTLSADNGNRDQKHRARKNVSKLHESGLFAASFYPCVHKGWRGVSDQRHTRGQQPHIEQKSACREDGECIPVEQRQCSQEAKSRNHDSAASSPPRQSRIE